jgi:hypothetical protein
MIDASVYFCYPAHTFEHIIIDHPLRVTMCYCGIYYNLEIKNIHISLYTIGIGTLCSHHSTQQYIKEA